jgi:hypothetical protein
MKGYILVWRHHEAGYWQWSILVPMAFSVKSLCWRKYKTAAGATRAAKDAARRCGIELIVERVAK